MSAAMLGFKFLILLSTGDTAICTENSDMYCLPFVAAAGWAMVDT